VRRRTSGSEVARLEPDQTKDSATHALLRQALDGCNRRLPDFKRVHRYLVWDEDFPRTASMKIKRNELADAIRARQASEAEAVAL
jgi:acyl-coenzyme A synthetase/AMP-(fatty) acid ligase